MEDERFITSTKNMEDEDVENTLRPTTMEEYVVQDKIKNSLNIYIKEAKKRGEALDHVLLYGPPGLGKTTLSHIIANELGSSLKITSGPAIEKVADLASILTNLNKNDVLFIDEIHRLSRAVEEVLYPAMEDYALDFILGKGPSARTMRLKLQPFTLIGATTKAGMLTGPLRDRFGVVCRLELYNKEELSKIIKRSAKILNIKIDDEACLELALRSRGTPRIANRFLKRVRDYAEIKGEGIITLQLCKEALEMLEVDELGLDYTDRKLLLTIIDKFHGGPVGLDTLSAATGEESNTIEDVYEPYLLQLGFIARTPRGRIALPNAYSVADPSSGVEAIMAFGFIPLVGCQGSVLTAIVTGFIGAKLEKKLRKIMPNVLDLIFTPFFVMLITMLVILLGVGPIMHQIELGMVSVIEALIHLPFGIGGFIIGFTYPLAVITGLHHTYVMIETSLLANTGFNPLITLCAMYGFANVGTCLAFALKSKSRKIKQTSIGAMLSQLFGISEPVLFGIQLRFNLKPLVIMLITSGTGAALLSLFQIQSNSYGLAVLPSYLMYIYEAHQLLFYFLISVLCVAMCFILTYLFAIPQEALVEDEEV